MLKKVEKSLKFKSILETKSSGDMVDSYPSQVWY